MKHVVKQGECLSTIAAQYGFSDWHDIYNDGANADLRKKRPNPDVLYPGDEVTIPEFASKSVDAPTRTKAKFVVRTPKRPLKLKMLDQHGLPIKNEPYTAVAGKVMFYGVTTGDGEISVDLPATAGSLAIWIACEERTLTLGALNPMEDVPDDGISGVQGRLLGLGFDPGPLDGEIGPLTSAAIVAFQRHYGIKVTGEPDSTTRARLKKEFGA
jgi:putative peptidoglycan binding protein/LysM domain-containing protein